MMMLRHPVSNIKSQYIVSKFRITKEKKKKQGTKLFVYSHPKLGEFLVKHLCILKFIDLT